MSVESSSSSTSSSDQLSPLNRNDQIRNVENYTPGGEKVKSHGVNFHDQVILSYLCKFMARENFNYNITCEVDEAGKFDDLVIFFEKDERTVCRLIQVKSNESGSKKLSRASLRNDDNTFGLKMYFLSYVKVLAKHEFEKKFACEIEELILHTNIDVDDELRGDLEKYEDEFFGRGEFYYLKNTGCEFKESLVKLLGDCVENDINKRKDKIKKDKRMSETEKEKKMNDLKYLTDLRPDDKKKYVDDFVRKFKFHVGQPNKVQLERRIKKDMKQCLRKYKLKNLNACELFLAYTILYDKIYTFHSRPNVEILTDEKFVDWFKEACTCRKSSLIVFHEFTMKCLKSREFRFEENPIETLERRIENCGGHVLNIVARAGFELTLTKLNAVFKDKKFSLITDQQFLFISENDIEVEKIEHLIVKCENDDAMQDILDKSEEFFDTISADKPNAPLEKIILVSRSRDDCSSEMCTTITDETEWNDLHKDVREKLGEERDVYLQGRNVKLTSIEVSRFVDLLKNEILHILVGSEEIKMGKPIECGNVFVERRISVRNKISAEIFKTGSGKEVFLISNTNETQFQSLQSSSKCRLVRSVMENPVNHFLDLCGQHSSETVTWLHRENGEYFVRRSTSIDQIRPKMIESSARSFDLPLLTSIEDPLVLIIAEPGMGKSELLSVLARRTIENTPGAIVAKVNLNDHTKQFKELRDDKRTFRERETAIDFIVETLLCDTNDGWKEFEKNYFRRHFDRFADRLIVLFDGFDEIASRYRDAVLDLIESIGKIRSIRLWVTSRAEEKKALETRLNVLSYTIDRFEKKDQLNFFLSYWQRYETDGRGVRSERLERFVDRLIDVTSKSLRDEDHRMMGVPLQCRMLGDVYNGRFEEYYGSDGDDIETFLPESIDILELYEEFVEQKLEIFESDKIKSDSSKAVDSKKRRREKERLSEAFSYSGLCAVFAENDLKDILPSSEQIKYYMEEIESWGEEVGIVYKVEDSTPVFIHRTFAEYFAAKWVYDRIESTDGTEKRQRLVDFFKLNFFETKFEVVRRFFDRMSAKGEKGSIFQAVLNNDRPLVSDLLERDLNSTKSLVDFDRNVLHLCAAYECHDLIRLFLEKKQPESTATEKLCGWKPIEYACAVRNLKNVDAFLEVNDEDLSAYERVGDENALLEAAKNGYVNLVKYLIKNGVSRNSANGKNETCLHLAAAGGHLEISRYLVEDAAADVHILDVNCTTVLHFAAHGGNVDIMKLLIKAKLNVDARNSVGCTPLHEAAWQGKNEAFKYLVEEAGANIHIRDDEGRSVLHCAAKGGNMEIIKLLTADESNVNVRDHSGCTPLHYATANSKTYAFKYLVEAAGANINICSDQGKSILHFAAQEDNMEIIKLLAPDESNVNVKDLDGCTPLLIAAMNGKNNTFKYLVEEAGADINICSDDGRSVLHYAAQGSNMEIIKLLTPDETNVNVKDRDGFTPLHIAAICGNNSTFKYLVEEAGANINICSDGGRSVLHHAAQGGNIEIIKLLTPDESNVNVKDHKGCTSLHYAAMSGKSNAFKYLVEEASANIDICSDAGRSVLHYAAQGGNMEIIKLFTRNESNVNVKDRDGYTPLHIAAIGGRSNAFKYLVEEAGANINICSDGGRTVWHYAAQGGNIEIIKLLTPNESNVNIKDHKGCTPLHYAAMNGKNNAFKYLVREAGANINICSDDGRSGLHYAALGGNMEIIKLLTTDESNVNIKDHNGCIPLHYAAIGGKSNAFKYLVEEAGANINICSDDGRSILHYVALGGNMEIIKLLAPDETNVNVKDRDGYTPLHIAAVCGKNKAFEYLVEEAGANIDIRSNNGKSVLHFAAQKGNIEIIKFLTPNESNVNIKDHDGCTPLHYAVMNGKNNAFEYLVEEASANIDIRSDKGRSVLHYAAQEGNIEIIKFLTPNESNVNIKDHIGYTPLHYAVMNGKNNAFEYLVEEAGANIDICSDKGRSVLHFAAQEGNMEIIKFLTQNESNVDVRDRDGCTPLHIAAVCGKSNAFKYLVEEAGANINICSDKGSSVLQFAAKGGNTDIIKFLTPDESNVNLKNCDG